MSTPVDTTPAPGSAQPAAPAPSQPAPTAPPAAPAPGSQPAPTPAPPAPAPAPGNGIPGGGSPADRERQQEQPATPGELTAEQVAQLPEWAQKEIRETRRENQNLRQTREQANNTAAEQAQKEFAERIGKALGLVPDEAPTDPQALLQAAQTAQQQAAERARVADVRLAVFQTAANRTQAELLLDSRAFDDRIRSLDPTAPDFAAQVASAVSETVTQNPARYGGAAPAAPANTDGSTPTGTPAGGTPQSVEEFRKNYREYRGIGG